MRHSFTEHLDKLIQFLRHLYLLFTKDLSREEFERLFSNETRGMYDFYVRSMPSLDGETNKVVRFLKFSWHLFIAFLSKLTPARRLFYGLAVLFMILAVFGSNDAEAIYAFVIVTFLLALETADRLVTKDELEVAREIQLSLQPTQFDPTAPFDVAAYSDVAKRVGGDHFDFMKLVDGSNLIVIADVAGKGISAALYAVKVQTALQLLTRSARNVRSLMVNLNEYLYGHLKRNYFLTVGLLRLLPDGSAEYCRAGHPPALYWNATMKELKKMQPRGTAIGMSPSTPNGICNGFGDTIETETTTLAEGDVILLYTDGVVETVNRMGEEFGEARLESLVKTFAADRADALKQRLALQLTDFASGADLRDDTTFVVIKKK